MSSDTFRTHFAPAVRLHDWPQAITRYVDLTGLGSGIVDCTVGNPANPNATYNSVQAAFNDGCFFVRIIDGLVGGQVPGYLESPFTVTQPSMIYIDPGVDWVLRESLIGAGGIDVSGQTLVLRGSGWESIMSLEQDGGASDMFLTDATSRLFLYDLQHQQNTALTFISTVYELLYYRNCRILATDNVGGAAIVSAANGGNMEFHECTFTGGGNASLMIGATTAGYINLSDCVADGTYAAVSAFDLTAPNFGVNVNGLLCNQTGAVGVDIGGGGVADNIQQISATDAVALSLVGTDGVKLSNVKVDSLTISCPNNEISNLEVLDAAGTVTVGTTNNKFSNGIFGGSLIVSANNNVFNACQITGTTDITADSTTFEGTFFTGTLTHAVANVDLRLIGCEITPAFTISGDNVFADNCIFRAAVDSLGGSINHFFSNCCFESTVIIRAAGTRISNCDAMGGALTITSGSTHNEIVNSRFAAVNFSGNAEAQISNSDVSGLLDVSGVRCAVSSCTVGSFEVSAGASNIHTKVSNLDCLGTALFASGETCCTTSRFNGAVTFTLSGNNNQFASCRFLAGVTASGLTPRVKFSSCEFTLAGGISLHGVNWLYDNCLFVGPVLNNGVNDGGFHQITNCSFLSTLTLTLDNHIITNNNFLLAAAGTILNVSTADNNIISGNRFANTTGGVVIDVSGSANVVNNNNIGPIAGGTTANIDFSAFGGDFNIATGNVTDAAITNSGGAAGNVIGADNVMF